MPVFYNLVVRSTQNTRVSRESASRAALAAHERARLERELERVKERLLTLTGATGTAISASGSFTRLQRGSSGDTSETTVGFQCLLSVAIA